MNPNEQLLSFTGTLAYQGKHIAINYNRLINLILDKNTSPERREAYRKQLEKTPEQITTVTNIEPELLYFQRNGDRYLISTRGPGRYNNHLLSMEGPFRTWSAYSGNNPTGFVVTLFGRGRNNITLEDLVSDQLNIIILAGGSDHLSNYRLPGTPASFTDNEDEDFEIDDFQLTIIDRNVAP
jgi:hypothetical protein